VRRMAAPEDTLPEGIVSSYLVAMQVGEHILCTAPFGALMPAQKEMQNDRIPVLLSHGLGISPMLSLLYELEARQARAAFLFHEPTAHDPQGLLREVHALMERNPGFQMIQVAPGQADAELIRRHVPLAQAEVHIAGTRNFAERLSSALKAAGLPSSALAVQGFG